MTGVGCAGAGAVGLLVVVARAASDYTPIEMQPLRARVRNGRLVLDEPTDLPEGEEIELVPVIDDELDAEERAKLERSLEASLAQAKAGRLIAGGEALARLRARRT